MYAAVICMTESFYCWGGACILYLNAKATAWSHRASLPLSLLVALQKWQM